MELVYGSNWENREELINTHFTGIYWIGGMDRYFEYWINGKQHMFGWVSDVDKMKLIKIKHPEAYKTLVGLILSGK